MRILSLSFRNLNSLAGEWRIDFRAPEYEASGIFAITGPTGAGKSTILDAICLALYGSTPRLPNISKNVNDIMTRGTGDCYADVTFRTTRGEFRCRWSQRKARGKADGNLQQPRHELFDAEGTPLADKMQDVARMVEELTGMDFGRFTQSTLLAQGRFATFLLAEGRDRAPLLEQMTGTAIYSKISEHIFQRNKEEQARLEALDTKLAHCSVLSDEEELALKEECSRISQAISGTGEKEKELTAGLHLHQLYSALEQERKALLDGQALLESKEQNFASDRNKLDTARRALLFSGDCSALLTHKKEQERDDAEASALNASLVPLSEEVQKKETLHTVAATRLDNERKAHAALLEILKGVRALDIQIKERREEKAQRELKEKEAVRHEASLCASLSEHTALLEKDRSSLKETNAWLEARASDVELPQRLSALRISSSQLSQQKKRLDARTIALEEKRRALALKTLSCAKQGELHATLVADNKKLEDSVTALDAERLHILEGKSPADWRKEQDSLNVLDARLARMLDFSRSLHALHQRCAELDFQLKELDQSREKEAVLLRSDEARLNDIQALRQELAESLALLERIRSYEEARLQLEDGSPCPLCGALHHPYAEGNLPAPDEKRIQLQSCEQNIRALNEQLGNRRATLASLERDKEHKACLLQEKTTEAEKLTTCLAQETEMLPPGLSLAMDGDEKELENILESHRKHCQVTLSAVATLLAQAEERMERLQEQREHLELARKNTELVLKELRALEQEKTALEAEVRGLAHELEAEATLFERDFDKIRLDLTALGYIAHHVEETPGILQRLEARLEEFLKKQAAAEALQSSCTELEKLYLVEEQEKNDAGRRLVEHRDSLTKIAANLESLQKERHELFGDKDADRAEQEGAERLNCLESELRQCVADLDSAKKKRDDSATRLAMLQKRLAERAVSIAANERALNAELSKVGFNGLQHCLDSCLSDKEREALEEHDRALNDRKTSLLTRLQDNERRRSEITKLPESSEEELRNSLKDLKAQQASMQEELGAKREKLESNASRKKTASEVLLLRQKQEAICRRWADLNKLIGSADGQKFRNYAQELTFRSLIRHANRQLSSMTDRYLLVQSPDEALSLSVIDHYQADAVRTSRNLSGGESFLVSLSLALGLARMASLSVSVDSVFLDEGFGTLDEDSLNMALDMLSNLRQQGKVIGIISHVQAIRERIGTRIQVETSGNGRSILHGPGIKKIPYKA